MKQSATQRIQVGIIGLVVVLLFVSLANMALDRASDEPAVSQMPGSMPSQGEDAAAETKPGEPLAELGVTPVDSDDNELPGAPDAASANVDTTAKPRR